MSQFASFIACQIPFRFGLPSAVRKGVDGAWAVAGTMASSTPATTAAVIRIELPRLGLRLPAGLLGVVLQVTVSLDACKFQLLVIRRGDAPEGFGDLPWCRESLRVLDGRFVLDGIRIGEREALDHMDGVGMDVSGRVQPCPVILIGRVHDEGG